MTKALFNEEIKPTIIEQIEKATTQICIVVAWFNDTDIFNRLLYKAQNSNIEIKIILSEEYEGNGINAQLNFSELLSANDNVFIFKIPKEAVLVHHKFCVLDRKIIISGSYNWTFGANFQNREGVLLIENEEKVCQQFLDEFDKIFNKYCNPIITSSTLKLQDLFSLVQKNIEHGNIRLAINVDDVVNNIKTKYLSLQNSEDSIKLSFEDFNEQISTESDDETIIQWWELLPDNWKSFFLKNILKLPSNAIPEISSLTNLLSAIENLSISENGDLLKGNLLGLKNLLCIKSLSCSNSKINSLSGINTLKELISLNVTGNLIKDFKEVNELPLLEELDLTNNQVATMEYLSDDLAIKQFYFYGNPCATLKGIENLKALETFTCDIRFAGFPIEINRLANLGLTKQTEYKIKINNTNTFFYFLKFERELTLNPTS